MFMTAFYMLSGFVLAYINKSKDLCDWRELKRYGLKRIIGVMPVYWAIGIIYTVYIVVFEDASILKNIALIPIETLGLQSVFCSLFGESHNGGTWFISCLLFCYAVFPLLQLLERNMDFKAKEIGFFLIAAVLLYSSFIVHLFKTYNIYSNPFFRVCEFILGVLLCDIWMGIRKSAIYKQWIARWQTVFLALCLLVGGVTFAWTLKISRGDYMLYSWIGIPTFTVMMLGLCGIRFDKLGRSKLFQYCIDVSYVFFLAQFFTWTITKVILNPFGGYENAASPIKTIISFTVCCVLTVLIHEMIELPMTRGLKKKLLMGA